MINALLKSFSLLIFMIIIGSSSTKIHSSKNEDIVKSYIYARNNYDIEKVNTLINENYLETFIDGSIEIENKGQLLERVLWGKEMNSKIKLLEIKSDHKIVTTIEENTNYIDVVLKRKSRKFKIVYTFIGSKIKNQKIDTLPGYYQVSKFNSEKYEKFVKYCEQNKLIYNNSLNQEFGIHLRKVLEKYKRDNE